MKVIHDEDFNNGEQRVIYQFNFKFGQEVLMVGFKYKSESMESLPRVVAKFTIRPKK